MKQGVSTLNPYAASYVPLSKREAHGITFVAGKQDSFNYGQHHLHSTTSASEKLPESFQVKSKATSSYYGSYGSPHQNLTGFTDNNLWPDDDPDMDIEFLRMQFPGISEESVRDVYSVNECDLDAAVEMLKQLELEFDGVESSRSLPETLDIGDVSESGPSADSASSLKLKNVAAEASTSSNPSANVS